jgi:hypothetical protein
MVFLACCVLAALSVDSLGVFRASAPENERLSKLA